MRYNRTNQDWLGELTAEGDRQEKALGDLRDLVTRAAFYTFFRSRSSLPAHSSQDLQALAEDCAQEAVLAVLRELPQFRGESLFTTWAFKFGVHYALSTIRKEQWKAASLEQLYENVDGYDWPVKGDEVAPADSEQTSLQEEISTAIRSIVQNELTGRQREIFKLMVFDEVPMDAVVEHFQSNRNAVYKLLHDARKKIRLGLQARGYEIDEVYAVFVEK